MEALADRHDTTMCVACGLALEVPRSTFVPSPAAATPVAAAPSLARTDDPAASIAALVAAAEPVDVDAGPPPPTWAVTEEPAAPAAPDTTGGPAVPAAPDATGGDDTTGGQVAPAGTPSPSIDGVAGLDGLAGPGLADAALAPLGPPDRCPHCGTTTAMAPAVPVSDTTIQVGFIGSGRGARAALSVADGTGSIALVTEDGVVRRTSPRHLRHFTPLRGLGGMTSPTAAALVGLEHLAIPALAASEAARRAVLEHGVGGDLVRARRVASDLAAAGLAAPIGSLPLGEAEQHWWMALAELRVQRFDQAITHLASLPLGAYPPAVGLLVLCTGAPIAAVSRRARTVLEQRLLAVDAASPLSGAATVSGRRTPVIDWLVHPEPFAAVAGLRADFTSPALRVLQALAG